MGIRTHKHTHKMMGYGSMEHAGYKRKYLDTVLLKGTIVADPAIIGVVHHYIQVIIIEGRIPKQDKNNL